jgi:hemerythrin-like domain-containing protein
MTALIENLEADHKRFRRYLVLFSEEVRNLAQSDGPDYVLLNQLATYFAGYPDELHHKEEDIIYARLVAKARNRRVELINLQQQHAELSKRANHFSDIVLMILNNEQLPIEKIIEEAAAYRNILTAHMTGEEEALFRPARSLLNENDWWEIEQAIGDLYAEQVYYEKTRSILAIEKSLDEYDRY